MDEPTSILALVLAIGLAVERVATAYINKRGAKPSGTNSGFFGERGSASNGSKAQQLAIDRNAEDIRALTTRVEEMGRLLARLDERTQRE